MVKQLENNLVVALEMCAFLKIYILQSSLLRFGAKVKNTTATIYRGNCTSASTTSEQK